MMVLLHGHPGQGDKVLPYDVPVFQEVIRVPFWMMPSPEVVSRGYVKGPTEHFVQCRFTHHDGVNCHYQASSTPDV